MDFDAAVGNHNVSHFPEGLRVQKTKRGTAIAPNDVHSILSESPSFAAVMKDAQQAKAATIVNESRVRFPCELDKSVSPIREPFAKVLCEKIVLLEDSSGLQVDLAQRGLPVQSSALIKMTVQINQALRECRGIVWINVNDAISECRRFVFRFDRGDGDTERKEGNTTQRLAYERAEHLSSPKIARAETKNYGALRERGLGTSADSAAQSLQAPGRRNKTASRGKIVPSDQSTAT